MTGLAHDQMFDRTHLHLKDEKLSVVIEGVAHPVTKMRIYTNSHGSVTKVYDGSSNMPAVVFHLLEKMTSWKNIASRTFKKNEEGCRVANFKLATPFWANLQEEGSSGKLERRRVTKVQLQYDA